MSRDEERIPEDAARAIWRRAAQLQAEAERRMEERARRALPGGGGPGDGFPEDGFDPDDVEAAAVEAGISPDFVRIALAERAAADSRSVQLSGWEARAARTFLGTAQTSIGLNGVAPGTLDAVSAAVLVAFPGPPCLLHPGEVADLPAGAGRVIVFNVPKMDWGTSSNPPFAEKASFIGLRQVHATVRPLDTDPPSCEIVVAGDLSPGRRIHWRLGGAATAGTAAGTGAFGALIGTSAALSGAILALPVVAGVAAGGAMIAGLWGLTYRYYVREVEKSLEEGMSIVRTSARATTMYGRSPIAGGADATRTMPPAG